MKARSLLSCGLALFLLGVKGVLAQPMITDFDPKFGAPGDTITLYGSGFASGTSFDVYFWNGQRVTSGFVNGDIQMTVIVPIGTTTGPIGIQPFGGSIS